MHYFAFCECAKPSRLANLPTKFHARYCGLQVVRVGQRIGVDLYRVVRVESRQANLTATFRQYDTSIQCPRSRRWIKLGACLGTADGYFNLAGLQIRSVKTRIALPEERCLSSIVARSERLLILPDTAESGMILKVLSYTWKMLDD